MEDTSGAFSYLCVLRKLGVCSLGPGAGCVGPVLLGLGMAAGVGMG